MLVRYLVACAVLGVSLMAAPASTQSPSEAAEREAVERVLAQVLAEDDNVGHFRDYREHEYVSVRTRGRASNVGGVCELDILRIERAATADTVSPGGATIRSMTTKRWFFVITGENGDPAWDLRYDALERACVAVQPGDHRWFEADDQWSAKAAVVGLLALGPELRRRSRTVQWDCMPSRCPEGEELASRLEPLRPAMAVRAERGCESGQLCVGTLLRTARCPSVSVTLIVDSVGLDRFRGARIGHSVGDLHCGEQQAYEERLEAEADDGQ